MLEAPSKNLQNVKKEMLGAPDIFIHTLKVIFLISSITINILGLGVWVF
jgi:hypothetical protein